ncbi:hypothetical protein [Prochlorococcus marinus]|uniref:hypothetical protein n=1 Tax=Prochlorococcus marinus TaxID=1219 RepID=UPI0022B2F671|nr:hypothetical protein [Prochlorococcus marinus]
MNEFSKYDNSTSSLISSVGDLSKVSFKCPLNDKSKNFGKEIRDNKFKRYIRLNESHIHISVSDENCIVFGSNVLPGSIVLKSLDFFIGVTPDLVKTLITSSINKPSSVIFMFFLIVLGQKEQLSFLKQLILNIIFM